MKKPTGPEIILSIDGEFTGKIPGLNSMISMGVIAYKQSGIEIGRFKANLKEPPGALRDDDTMRWWAQHPEAWAKATKDPVDPIIGMRRFANWIAGLHGRPKLAGWPLPVDFMFFYWYYVFYLREDTPFGFDGIDIKTYAMAELGYNALSDVSMGDVFAHLGLPQGELSHEPVDDCRRQAQIYFGLRERAKAVTH